MVNLGDGDDVEDKGTLKTTRGTLGAGTPDPIAEERNSGRRESVALDSLSLFPFAWLCFGGFGFGLLMSHRAAR